ncbi:MAG: LptF/LptG family permease, partial [bacterium]|nr:LptF/LptG family permease [bacterium]MDW8164616.1 LptF/LptG family permease [Candidatus Omnitrophota bacterium]
MKFKTKYLFKEFFINFSFSFLILTIIFTLKNFFQLFEFIVKGSLSILPIIKYFIFTIISLMQYIIPLSILVSSISVFSTFYSDKELNIFAFSGIPYTSLIKPFIIFTIIFTIFLLYFNFFILPDIRFSERRIIHQLKIKNPLSIIIEKEIIREIPGITIYVEKVFKNFNLKNISITKREDNSTFFLKAEKGKLLYKSDENKLVFILENGNFLSYTENSISSVDFKEYEFFIQLTDEFKKTDIKREINELKIGELRKIKNTESLIEFHERILYSITPLVLFLLGTSIGMNLKQKNKMLYIGVGGFISILFFEILILG